jgi:NTE family protein
MMKNILKRSAGKGHPATGIALGSGAARGLSHIGVLKVLSEKGVEPDLVTGSSIGALVGACYCREGGLSSLEEFVLGLDLRELMRLIDPNMALAQKGFIRGAAVKQLLEKITGDISFDELDIPLAVVASDIHTGEEVVIREGSVVEAVRASISMPVTFVPVKIGDRFLMDGGIVDPVPVELARDLGAEVVIASVVEHGVRGRVRRADRGDREKSDEKGVWDSILGGISARSGLLSRDGEGIERKNVFIDKITELIPELREIHPDTPNMFYVLTQALYSMQNKLCEQYVRTADVIIRPDVEDFETYDFDRGREALERGEKAAYRVLDEIKRKAGPLS